MSAAMHSLDFYDTLQGNMKQGSNLAKAVGCAEEGNDLLTHPQEVIRCLRVKPVDQLLFKMEELATPYQVPFGPTFHNQFLPRAPSVAVKRKFFNNVDVILGLASDECAAFFRFNTIPEIMSEEIINVDQDNFERALNQAIAPLCKFEVPGMVLEFYKSIAVPGDLKALRRAYIDYGSDRLANCLTQFFAEKYSEIGNTVYTFVFGHKSPKSKQPAWVGVNHAEYLRHLMPGPMAVHHDHPSADEAINVHMANMLASFAERG